MSSPGARIPRGALARAAAAGSRRDLRLPCDPRRKDRLPGDLSFRRRRRSRLARAARPRNLDARRRADRCRGASPTSDVAAAAGRRRHRLRRRRHSTLRALSRSLIKFGAAAMHIEDQVGAKRCGHRPNKELVAAERDGRSRSRPPSTRAVTRFRRHGAHRRAGRRGPVSCDRPRRAPASKPAPT